MKKFNSLDGDYQETAQDIAALLEQKRKAYGASFESAGQVLSLLYPNGIPLNQYDDLLCVTRIIDKLFRIATDKDAFGESPYHDIAGYGILGAVNADRKNTKPKDSEAPSGP